MMASKHRVWLRCSLSSPSSHVIPRRSSSSLNSSASVTGGPPRVVHTIEEYKAARLELIAAKGRGASTTIGFVPTMGALHAGHVSLAEAARSASDLVVASVFVNPAQFAAHEDLGTYPRTLDADVEILGHVGTDLVFAPNALVMYPEHFSTYVDMSQFDEQPGEGSSRPGFFRGVATVCTKLFNIIEPTHVYFGQKDAMQCAVIRRLIEDFNIPVTQVVVPTVREEDGLAMSSRNVYLNAEERAAAPVVYQSLRAGVKAYMDASSGGSTPVPRDLIESAVRERVAQEPMVSSVDYVSVASRDTMQEVDEVVEGAVLSMAVRMGEIRLLDNVILGA